MLPCTLPINIDKLEQNYDSLMSYMSTTIHVKTSVRCQFINMLHDTIERPGKHRTGVIRYILSLSNNNNNNNNNNNDNSTIVVYKQELLPCLACGLDTNMNCNGYMLCLRCQSRLARNLYLGKSEYSASDIAECKIQPMRLAAKGSFALLMSVSNILIGDSSQACELCFTPKNTSVVSLVTRGHIHTRVHACSNCRSDCRLISDPIRNKIPLWNRITSNFDDSKRIIYEHLLHVLVFSNRN